jgi:hypothetical protein
MAGVTEEEYVTRSFPADGAIVLMVQFRVIAPHAAFLTG